MSHVLKLRAEYLAKLRSFFSKSGVLEVDTPILSPAAQIDQFIEPIKTECGYLHTSPEHRMKELLASGSGDIYQICHTFRKNEHGALHRVEFTMIEWYRLKTTLPSFIEENLSLIALFLPNLSHNTMTYHEAFARILGIDPDGPLDRLQKLSSDFTGRSSLLNYIWATHIEPDLGKGCLTTITDFPADQAALARLHTNNTLAARFEIYHKGIELANGFHELNDSCEQQKRYEEANALREIKLPLDFPFLEAVGNLPDCCGVALGFDRLLMLSQNEEDIGSVIATFGQSETADQPQTTCQKRAISGDPASACTRLYES